VSIIIEVGMYPGQSSSPLLSCFSLHETLNESSSPLLSCFSLHETLNENIAVGSVLAARNIFENPDLNFASQLQPTTAESLKEDSHL